MKLAPDRMKFMEVIGGTGNINLDIEKFCTNFSPLLEENHKFLVRSLSLSLSSYKGFIVHSCNMCFNGDGLVTK